MPDHYDCMVGTDIGPRDVAAVRVAIATSDGVFGPVQFIPNHGDGYRFTFKLVPPMKTDTILGLSQAAGRATAIVYAACVLVTGASPGADVVEVTRGRHP